MLMASGWILTAGLILGGGVRAYGQMGFPGGQLSFPGGQSGQVPPEMAEMRRAQERLMKEAAPEFYAFQDKLRGIEAEIGETVASLARKEIDKGTAREKILPLIKQQQEIQNDPEFLVEQRLAQGYFSSPQYRKKAEKVMRALAEKQKRKAKPGAVSAVKR